MDDRQRGVNGSAPTTPSPSAPVKRLLVVDDEEPIRLAFAMLLERPGLEVRCVGNLEEASEAVATGVYHAMIADLGLSGFGGTEGFELLRLARECTPPCRAILVTAYGSVDVMNRARELGAAFYFEKPVSADALRNALSELGL